VGGGTIGGGKRGEHKGGGEWGWEGEGVVRGLVGGGGGVEGGGG